MNFQPIQVGKLNSTFKSTVVTNTANTDRTGATGTFTLIGTVGSGDGGRIDRIDVQAYDITTAGRILIFESNDAGATKQLIGELVVALNATVDATNSPWRDTFYFNGNVPRSFIPGARIYVAPTKAEKFIARIDGGDY